MGAVFRVVAVVTPTDKGLACGLVEWAAAAADRDRWSLAASLHMQSVGWATSPIQPAETIACLLWWCSGH